MGNRPKSRLFKVKPTPYLLLLPSITLFCVFTFIPFIRNIFLSFSVADKRGNAVKWVGFNNFLRLFAKEDFWKILGNTFLFAAIVAIFTLLIAMVLALLCSRPQKGGRIYQTMYAISMSVASVPASAMFLFIFKQNGILNRLLGTDIAWLINVDTALGSVAFATVWLSIVLDAVIAAVCGHAVPLPRYALLFKPDGPPDLADRAGGVCGNSHDALPRSHTSRNGAS